jgi:hypothetical protein
MHVCLLVCRLGEISSWLCICLSRSQIIQVSITHNNWFTIQLSYQDVRAYLSLEGRLLHDRQDLSMAYAMAGGGGSPWLTIGDMQRPPNEAIIWQQAISHRNAYDVLAATAQDQPTVPPPRGDELTLPMPTKRVCSSSKTQDWDHKPNSLVCMQQSTCGLTWNRTATPAATCQPLPPSNLFPSGRVTLKIKLKCACAQSFASATLLHT